MCCDLRTFTFIDKEMTIWQKWWQSHRYGQRWFNCIGLTNDMAKSGQLYSTNVS